MFAGGLFVGLSLLLSVIPLVLIVVVFLFAGRGEPDPEGRRPYASYLCAVSFVTMFLALFSLFAVATSMSNVVTNDGGSSVANYNFTPNPSTQTSDTVFGTIEGSSGGPVGFLRSSDDAHWNSAVQAGLVAIASLALLMAHLRRLSGLAREPGFFRSAAWRVHQVFLYLVCFIAVLTVLGAGVSAAYGLFRALAPGVTQTATKSDGVSQLVTSGLLALAAGAIYRSAWTTAQRNLVEPPEPFEPPAALA